MKFSNLLSASILALAATALVAGDATARKHPGTVNGSKSNHYMTTTIKSTKPNTSDKTRSTTTATPAKSINLNSSRSNKTRSTTPATPAKSTSINGSKSNGSFKLDRNNPDAEKQCVQAGGIAKDGVCRK